MSAAHVICILAPIRIWSEANLRGHWRSKAARVKGQRQAAAWSLMQQPKPALPAVITIARIAPRELDDDNLAGGCKAVRDGIADWLGLDDRDKRLTWRYEQRKGKRAEYATEIRIESGAAA